MHWPWGTFAAWCLLAIAAVDASGSQWVMLDYNLTLNSRSRDTVFVETFDDKPITQANFMAYVNGNRYNSSIMHRLSRDFVIQGGGFFDNFLPEPAPVNFSLDPNAKVDLDGNLATPNPMITNEYSVGTVRSNLTGTLAMARNSGVVNSATSQWFVNLKNNSFLDSVDGGFTVFAQVVGDGMSYFNNINGIIGTNGVNGVSIKNWNPDVNDDGIRDGGPFYNYNAAAGTDGVPQLGSNLVRLEKAKRIDYLGAGSTLNVPVGGLVIATRDVFIDTGTVFNGSPDGLVIGNGLTLGVREGYAINRSLINRGTLAPGLQLGSITVEGNYFQPFDGTLEIQLRETTPDIEHDRLVVLSAAYLAGVLDISLLGDFVPSIGDSFTVLSAGAIIGDFDGIALPMLNSGLVWDVSKTLTTYTLSVAAADFNRNGIVDAGDFVTWRKQRNTTVTAYSGADANGDGLVNDADLTIWRQNYGNVRGTSGGAGSLAGASVPEPSTLGLICLATGAILAARRRVCAVSRRNVSV